MIYMFVDLHPTKSGRIATPEAWTQKCGQRTKLENAKLSHKSQAFNAFCASLLEAILGVRDTDSLWPAPASIVAQKWFQNNDSEAVRFRAPEPGSFPVQIALAKEPGSQPGTLNQKASLDGHTKCTNSVCVQWSCVVVPVEDPAHRTRGRVNLSELGIKITRFSSELTAEEKERV